MYVVGTVGWLAALMLNVAVNNYGHVGMVRSPNQLFPGQA